jgi:uncharacterized membrane protein
MKTKFTAVQLSLVIMFCVSLMAIPISHDDSKTYLMAVNATIGVIWLINLIVNASQETDCPPPPPAETVTPPPSKTE